MAHEPRIAVDRSVPVPTDRLLTLTVAWEDLAELGPKIAELAEQLGLTMFDTQNGRLVVPRRSDSRPWPVVDSALVSAIRNAASEETLQEQDPDPHAVAERVRRSLGAVHAEVVLPSSVPLPMSVPASLRFAIPVAVSPRRRTKAALGRYLADLRDDRPEVRRAAAFDLAGWPAMAEVERALLAIVRDDSDGYVRAVAAIALAVQSDRYGPEIQHAAVAALAHASDAEERWAGLAASITLLAMCIVAIRTADQAMCGDAHSLADRLSLVATERDRADALARTLQESCPG